MESVNNYEDWLYYVQHPHSQVSLVWKYYNYEGMMWIKVINKHDLVKGNIGNIQILYMKCCEGVKNNEIGLHAVTRKDN